MGTNRRRFSENISEWETADIVADGGTLVAECVGDFTATYCADHSQRSCRIEWVLLCIEFDVMGRSDYSFALFQLVNP